MKQGHSEQASIASVMDPIWLTWPQSQQQCHSPLQSLDGNLQEEGVASPDFQGLCKLALILCTFPSTSSAKRRAWHLLDASWVRHEEVVPNDLYPRPDLQSRGLRR